MLSLSPFHLQSIQTKIQVYQFPHGIRAVTLTGLSLHILCILSFFQSTTMAEEDSINLEGESSSATPPIFPDVDVNPNQRLSSVLLNEFNYLPWERAVTLALG